MASSSKEIPKIALTAEHRERFRREAPEALRRRGRDWFAEQAWGAGELALTAIVSLGGLLLFGWSAPGVFVFSLACVWMAVLCDTLKIVLARAAVRRDAEIYNEERMFWGIADAIRNGKDEMRADTVAPYRPGAGLFVDYVFGGIATAVMVFTMVEHPRELVDAVATQPGLRVALLSTLGVQLLAALATIVRHWLPGTHAPMRFAAGTRGLGLFVLMFVSLMHAGGADTYTFVVVMNAALLLLAALSGWGVSLLRAETAWLRAQVARAAGRLP